MQARRQGKDCNGKIENKKYLVLDFEETCGVFAWDNLACPYAGIKFKLKPEGAENQNWIIGLYFEKDEKSAVPYDRNGKHFDAVMEKAILQSKKRKRGDYKGKLIEVSGEVGTGAYINLERFEIV